MVLNIRSSTLWRTNNIGYFCVLRVKGCGASRNNAAGPEARPQARASPVGLPAGGELTVPVAEKQVRVSSSDGTPGNAHQPPIGCRSTHKFTAAL